MREKKGLNAVRQLTLVCWVITALVLAGLIFWVFTGNLFGLQTGRVFSLGLPFENLLSTYEKQGDTSVPVSGISEISINWQGGDIRIIPYDGEDIYLEEFAKRALSEDESLFYTIEDAVLKISYRAPTESGGWRRMPRKRLTMSIPRALSENLENLRIDTSSGDLEVSDLTLAHFNAAVSSGDVNLQNIRAERIKTDSSSGDVAFSSVRALDIDVSSRSGKLLFCDTEAENLSTRASSGKQDLEGSFQNVYMNGKSGNILLKSRILPEHVEIESSSGDVCIAVPKSEGLVVQHDLSSGKFSSDFPVLTGGDSPQFRIKASSGDLRIETYES